MEEIIYIAAKFRDAEAFFRKWAIRSGDNAEGKLIIAALRLHEKKD